MRTVTYDCYTKVRDALVWAYDQVDGHNSNHFTIKYESNGAHHGFTLTLVMFDVKEQME